jgi:hypothetical protein
MTKVLTTEADYAESRMALYDEANSGVDRFELQVEYCGPQGRGSDSLRRVGCPRCGLLPADALIAANDSAAAEENARGWFACPPQKRSPPCSSRWPWPLGAAKSSSEQLDIVPQQVLVIRHERVKYACRCLRR